MDIDTQAVEVTKLSLLLKVLEEESAETIGQNLSLFSERALPDLGNNIKCGNSLIGTDFYEGRQMGLLDEDERLRINAFDWDVEFPEIFSGKNPGFDAVIGNPPYVRIQTLKEWAPVEVEFYKKRYAAAGKGNYDIYQVMIERGLELLNRNGLLGFIQPHKFFNANAGEALRRLLATGEHVNQILHFGDEQVFAGATTYTCLLFLGKTAASTFLYAKVTDLSAWQIDNTVVTYSELSAEELGNSDWNFRTGIEKQLFEKVNNEGNRLGKIAKIFVGTQTSADNVYVLDDCIVGSKEVRGYSSALEKEVTIEVALARPFLRGKHIRRYQEPASKLRLICPYEIQDDNFSLLSKERISKEFPKAWNYLLANETALRNREHGRFRDEEGWYAFGYPKSMTLFQEEKLIVPDYNNRAAYSFDTKGFFYKTGYGIIPINDHSSIQYLLGLLNSKLLFWFLRQVSTMLRGGYVRFWTQYVQQVPIRDRKSVV